MNVDEAISGDDSVNVDELKSDDSVNVDGDKSGDAVITDGAKFGVSVNCVSFDADKYNSDTISMLCLVWEKKELNVCSRNIGWELIE